MKYALIVVLPLIVAWLAVARRRVKPQTTPDAAVAQLTEAIATRADFAEHELYAAMEAAGIPASYADHAFKFTQIAWGREYLASLGNFTFAPDYVCFNARGDVIESGLLREQPYYIAAMTAATRYASSPGFQRFARMSADVSAITKAVEAGARPADLVVAPPALFMEPPTPAGIEKAQRFLSDRLAPRRNR